MKPPGPLMVEHRLIERMVKILAAELRNMTGGGKANPPLIRAGVDFFRTYADRTHHGKEEDILFRELMNKELSSQDRSTMDELIQEHILARQMVGRLASANDRYDAGEAEALPEITRQLEKLVEFYPRHIEKEDRHFFIPVLRYFSDEEQQAMLEEFWQFDRKMIHEKYKNLVESLEAD